MTKKEILSKDRAILEVISFSFFFSPISLDLFDPYITLLPIANPLLDFGEEDYHLWSLSVYNKFEGKNAFSANSQF